MPNAKSFGISGILAVVVLALLAGSLLPPAINAATGADFTEETESFTLSEGETYNLSHADANVTLDSVNTSADPETAEYTLADNSSSETATIDEGDNTTVTVDGTDYNVSVNDISSDDNTSDTTVTYKTGGGETANSIWIIVPIFMVLAVALYFVGFATSAKDGF